LYTCSAIKLYQNGLRLLNHLQRFQTFPAKNALLNNIDMWSVLRTKSDIGTKN